MSKASKKRFEIKNKYFNYLEKTALKVDPWVKKIISENGFSFNLEKILISRYRFGKAQLRPAQVRWGYELFGGSNWEQIIPACASVEMKDTGYYCLDDFFDKRQESNLVLLQGIISSLSYTMIYELLNSYEAEQVNKVLQELTNLDIKNAKAAFIDNKLKEPNMDLYFKKVEGYNFWETPLRIGAILAKTSTANINLIGKIGKFIGMGYIIANDTWDFGKDLEDFKAGKYTLPIIYLFEQLKSDEKKKLLELFSKTGISKKDENFIRKASVITGTIEYGKQIAQEYCNKGLELLESFKPSQSKRLLEFSTSMTQRNKFYDNLKKFNQKNKYSLKKSSELLVRV